MKSYEEYYKSCKKQCEISLVKSESMYGKNWWKKLNNNYSFGDNYEMMKPLSDKNDSPIVKNITNVYNSEWVILHHILSQMVIDYIKEYEINDDIFSYSISICFNDPQKRWTMYLKKYEYETISLPESEPYDFPSYSFIGDETIIRKFDTLNVQIYNYVERFFKDNDKDIPQITNVVDFSIDDIHSSVEYGVWCPASDSNMSVGWDRDGDNKVDEILVVCM